MAWMLPIESFPRRYRCCGCLHVRTGTLLLAVIQVLLHFIVIAILTAALGRSAHFRDDVEYVALSLSVMSFIQWERFASPEFPAKPVAQGINNPSYQVNTILPSSVLTNQSTNAFRPNPSDGRRNKYLLSSSEEYIAIAVTLLSLLFNMLLLVGTIYARPYYLLPYCLIQFVDLFVTCLSVVAYYTYLPESGTWNRTKLIYSLFIILAGVFLLSIKSYFLAMVWICYKFLLLYNTGFETSSGFSVTYGGGCPLLINLCQRLRCIEYVRGPLNTVSTGDILPQSHSTTLRSPTTNGRVIVLFRNPNSPTSPPVARLSEPCLPPKYEDALAMPSNAFAPPPYASLVGDNNTDYSINTPTGRLLPTISADHSIRVNSQLYTVPTRMDSDCPSLASLSSGHLAAHLNRTDVQSAPN